MELCSGKKRTFGITAVVLTCAALLLTFTAFGCGGSTTPDTAVKNFFQAINAGDSDALLGSVLPERVRAMSDTEKQQLETQVKAKGEQYTGLQLKVVYDKNDKSKAKVVISSGKISAKDPTTGQTQSQDFKDVPEESRTLNAVKYKGRWYVDIQLSQEEAQPQSATQPSQ
jgi:hypothetical protein